MVVYGNGESLFGMLLADYVVFQVCNYLAGRGHVGEQACGVAAPPVLLVQD